MESYFATTPERPGWITSLPLLGRRLGAAWDQVVQAKDNLGTLLEPYTADVQQFMISAARALADSVLQVLLSLIVATMFWTNGDAVVAMLHDPLRRLGGLIAGRRSTSQRGRSAPQPSSPRSLARQIRLALRSLMSTIPTTRRGGLRGSCLYPQGTREPGSVALDRRALTVHIHCR